MVECSPTYTLKKVEKHTHMSHWCMTHQEQSHVCLYTHWKALHQRTYTHLSWMKPVWHCLQSSFVVRQNSWADVVAVVITLGLTGSRWLSSYKPRVKAEGKHRHQNKKLSHRNVVTLRSRERVCVGGNHSRHNAELLNQRERERNCKRGKNKAVQNRQWNNRLVAFMQCHSYLGPFCRSNFARQMFLLVLIDSELKLERHKICRSPQMVSMKTPNRTYQRLFITRVPRSHIFLIHFEHERISLQNIVSFQCFLVISEGGEQSRAGCAIHFLIEKQKRTREQQARIQSKARL